MRWLASIAILLSFYSFGFQSSFADSLYAEAAKLPPKVGIKFMLNNSYFVYNKGYQDGIEWTQMAFEYAEKVGDESLIAHARLEQGTVWYLSGDYEKSIESYQDALARYEKINDLAGIGRTCNQLSVYYRKQKQYEEGLKQLDRSYQSCLGANDSTCVETSLNNRGVIYEMMGQYQLAKKFYRKAKRIAEKIGDDVGLSYIYNNLAECNRIEGNYDSVIYYVDLSTNIRLNLNDQQGVAMNYANLGETLTLAGKLGEAEEYLEKAVVLCQDLAYLDLLRHSYQLYYELNKKKGNLEVATYYLDQSLAIKDSILNVEKIKSLSEMEVRYETEKIEKEYAEEQQLRAESDLKLANRNNWIIGIVGAAVATLLLGLFLYQRRVKIAQEEKNKAVLEEKQKGLEAVFDATEEERQRIAKDLHDGVGQQMSGLKLAWENLSVELKQNDLDEANKLSELSSILDETAQEVREISHQMMPKVLGEYGLIPALEEMVNKSLKFSEIDHRFEHFNIEGRFPKRVELSLYRIAQELVNNVIKHSGASKVSIQLFKNNEQLILIVEDNGSGFNSTDQDGHGLLNIKSRLNTINGEVNYQASNQTGTMATVRVDLSGIG